MWTLAARLLAPTSVLVLTSLWLWLVVLGLLPPLADVVLLLESFFQTYGLPVVLLTSVLENITYLNAYLPGSVVILTAMALTNGDPLLGFYTFLAIHIGANGGYQISYVLGKILGKESFLPPPPKARWIQAFGTYWHPHLASLTSTFMGQHNVPWRTFTATAFSTSLVYNILWAVLIYNVGNFITKAGNLLWFFVYAYLILWIGYEVYRWYKTR